MAYVSELFEDGVMDQTENKIDLKISCAGKTVGIYFSAHWCPPCNSFTPVLASFYNNYSKNKNFEIIFVSADHTETSFKKYFLKMPWLALDYKYNKKMGDLCKKFNVTSIPSLVLLNADNGDIYVLDAVEKFNDTEINYFPWAK